MKKLQVPFNGDQRILTLYSEGADYIAEIYFAPHSSIFPTARQYKEPNADEHFIIIKQVCETCKQNSFNAALLLNGTNIQLTNDILSKVKNYLISIIPYGLTHIIVANPILAQGIHTNFPTLKIRLSVLSLQEDYDKIKQLSKLNFIHEICLPSGYNNNLEALQQLKNNIPNIQFSAIVNSGCRSHCPLYNWHHASYNSNFNWNSNDYTELHKSFHELTSNFKGNILQTPFVLPEELHYYDNYYHQFKLEDRTAPTEYLHNVLMYYALRINPINLHDCINGGCVLDKIDIIETKSLTNEGKKKRLNCKNNCENCCLCEKIYNEI